MSASPGQLAAAALRHVTTGGNQLPPELAALPKADAAKLIREAKTAGATVFSRLDRR